MGKGDRRTRKGKIFRDSRGKTRKNPKQLRRAAKAKAMAKPKEQPEITTSEVAQ
jgi:ribosomal small subunit protein bTHX